MNEPITVFKTTAEAVVCLKEWQTRLGLDDWIIKVKLCVPGEFEIPDSTGECTYTASTKAAVIRIMQPKYYGDRIAKYFAEKTLVHELLHCKLALLDTDNVGFDQMVHQIQDDFARALVMAKYGIDRGFFSNITYDEE